MNSTPDTRYRCVFFQGDPSHPENYTQLEPGADHRQLQFYEHPGVVRFTVTGDNHIITAKKTPNPVGLTVNQVTESIDLGHERVTEVKKYQLGEIPGKGRLNAVRLCLDSNQRLEAVSPAGTMIIGQVT